MRGAVDSGSSPPAGVFWKEHLREAVDGEERGACLETGGPAAAKYFVICLCPLSEAPWLSRKHCAHKKSGDLHRRIEH